MVENIRIHIEGDNLSTGNIKIPHIIKILSNIQNTVTLIAKSLEDKDLGVPRLPESNIEKYALSITGINSGSLELVIEASQNGEIQLFEKSNIVKKSIIVYNEIVDAYKESNLDKMREIIPHGETLKTVTENFVDIARYLEMHSLKLGVKTNEAVVEFRQDNFGVIYYKLTENTQEVFEDYYIGYVSAKNNRNKELEIWDGGKKSVLKAGKTFFKDLAPYFEKPVSLRVIFKQAKNKHERYLLSLLSIEEIKEEFMVYKINFKNKNYIFKNGFKLSLLRDGDCYEIHSKIMESFEFGENFAEAWQNFKEYFDGIYELLFESEYSNKLSESSLKLKKYLSENCAVEKDAF